MPHPTTSWCLCKSMVEQAKRDLPSDGLCVSSCRQTNFVQSESDSGLHLFMERTPHPLRSPQHRLVKSPSLMLS
jgi:hypothetical protein